MASLDLKDAYYSVGVNPSHRKYLRFVWKNVLYQFTACPTGYPLAPGNSQNCSNRHLLSYTKRGMYPLVTLTTFISKGEHMIFVSPT